MKIPREGYRAGRQMRTGEATTNRKAPPARAPAARPAGESAARGVLLSGPPRHAGDLEDVRVVAQRQQLVTATKRHAGGHVEVPAHIAAGVVGLARQPPAGSAGQSPRRRGPSPTRKGRWCWYSKVICASRSAWCTSSSLLLVTARGLSPCIVCMCRSKLGAPANGRSCQGQPWISHTKLPQSRHLRRSRPCSQTDAPPQSQHSARLRPCLQTDAPPQSQHWGGSRPCAQTAAPPHERHWRRCRPCSQTDALPQSQHSARLRPCTQTDAPPQSRHRCRCRPRSQTDVPPHSRH